MPKVTDRTHLCPYCHQHVAWVSLEALQNGTDHACSKWSGRRAQAAGPKYRNEPVVVDGERFDSKGEAGHYELLLQRQTAGEIEGLVRQPIFEIHVDKQLQALLTYNGDETP